MKRLFDIFTSIILIFFLFLPSILIIFLIKIVNKNSAIYISRRLGKNKKIFKMYKFRTMHPNTPEVGSNSLKNAEIHITKFGKILRKYSLDELPQLINVLKGDMSLVGPRPALETQHDLISLRDEKDIFSIVPGITGLAQINGRDDLLLEKKVEYEATYMKKKSFLFDILILLITLKIVIKSKGVKH